MSSRTVFPSNLNAIFASFLTLNVTAKFSYPALESKILASTFAVPLTVNVLSSIVTSLLLNLPTLIGFGSLAKAGITSLS